MPNYPSLYLPYSTSGGVDEEGGILEEIYVNISEIFNRSSKVLRYKGGRLPICNINGGKNTMKMSDIFYLPSLHKVKYEIDTAVSAYISLFI